jgi:hypothetical protein
MSAETFTRLTLASPEGGAEEKVELGVLSVDAVLRQAASDLEAIGARWAVIGGLAVAFRAEPRFTKDVDLAVAVADDQEAEDVVNRLQVRGYALASLVEQDYVNRLATARLVRPQAGTSSAFVGLLFANSGIEDEIVSRPTCWKCCPMSSCQSRRSGRKPTWTRPGQRR